MKILVALKKGTKAKTNAAYFEQYGRVVYGEIMEEHKGQFCIMLVTEQEGKAIPAYTGNPVVFVTKDLEKDVRGLH